MNTMADLRRECARRLRQSLHGREIDTLENNVETEHMLGIVPIGAISTPQVTAGTILDPKHEFWENFEEDVTTENGVKRRIESAIRSLRKDNVFRMTYPYGEEADIIYCEVDRLDSAGDNSLPTHCAECGKVIDAEFALDCSTGYGDKPAYLFVFTINCPYCDFSQKLETNLERQ